MSSDVLAIIGQESTQRLQDPPVDAGDNLRRGWGWGEWGWGGGVGVVTWIKLAVHVLVRLVYFVLAMLLDLLDSTTASVEFP